MFRKGLVYSFPIVMAYIPVAFTFGVLARILGFSEVETMLASLLIFAGASQFALISLYSQSLLNAIFIPIFLNPRHVIYSCIIAQKLKLRFPHISAFGLTDEVFAVSVNSAENERFLLGLELCSYSAWVGGTAIGVLAGSTLILDEKVHSALVFSISALFLVLMLPNLKGRHVRAAVGGGAVALAFHLLNLTSVGIIAAALAGPLLSGWEDE
jgi:4-azaleucine resistance transporter AzlC